MHFNFEESKRQLESKIVQLKGKEHLPGELINLLDEVSHLQLSARDTADVSVPDPEHCACAEDVIAGAPLLSRDRFPFDETQATDLFTSLTNLLQKAGNGFQAGASLIESAVRDGSLDLPGAFAAHLADDQPFFEQWAEQTPDAPMTLRFLVASSMGPGLEAAATALADRLPDVKTWNQGSCPICGSLPLISTLRDKEGARHATCSFCRHEYRIRRLACAICGEDDQKKLTFFTVDDEPGFRVDVCESCTSYMKTIDFREIDRFTLPVLDDLDSLALDYVATNQGYRRATLSAWGF